MNKKGLYITLSVAVVIAAVAYIAGSVNTNNDQVAAENTNVSATLAYSSVVLEGTNIQLDVPDTFSVCPKTSEFFPGLVAYIWRIDDCNNTQDAPDMQIFVVEDSSPESVIREESAVAFDNNPELVVEQKTVNGEAIFFAGSSGDEYFVAKQVGDWVVYISANRMIMSQDEAVVDHIIATAKDL